MFLYIFVQRKLRIFVTGVLWLLIIVNQFCWSKNHCRFEWIGSVQLQVLVILLKDSLTGWCHLGWMYHCTLAVQLAAMYQTETRLLHIHLKRSGISQILGFLSVLPGLVFPSVLHFCLCSSIKNISAFFATNVSLLVTPFILHRCFDVIVH